MLTARHRQQRLQWAQKRLNWNWRQWQNVLFTDESRYGTSQADGRIRVWRRRKQRYAANNVLEHNTWGGPSVVIWCAIGLSRRLWPVIFQNIGPGRGNGVNAQWYINQEIMPYFQQHANLTLQQNNTHTARITMAFLQQHNIRMMP